MKLLFTSFILFIAMWVMSTPPSLPPEMWELEFDKEGVQVYTQIEGSSPFKQVKVTTTINASMEKVMEFLLAFSRYPTWMANVTESSLINQSGNDYYVFFLEDAKWPKQDRYQVSRLSVFQSISKARISFVTVPNYIAKRQDAIQIRQHEGYWSLEYRSDRQCTLEFVLIHHPGGHIPPWLANYNVVDAPYKSILKLRELAESAAIRP